MKTHILPRGVRLFFISFFLLLGLGLFSFSSVHATDMSQTLYPTGDALVYSGEPNTNYGSMDVLESGYSESTGIRRQSFVKFDISTIPSNATIVTARFKLYRILCEATITPNSIYTGQVTTNWTESTVTWKTMPSYNVGSFQIGSCGSDNWLNFDVKKLVNNWRGGDRNYGLVVYSNSSTSYLRRYDSREYGGSTYQPELVITFTLPVLSTSSSSTGTVIIPGSSSSSSVAPTTPPDNTEVPDSVIPTPNETILPGEQILRDDFSDMPIFSPFVEMLGSWFFPCLTFLCCCLPLILLLILIVILLSRKKKREERPVTQVPQVTKKVETVTTVITNNEGEEKK